jgi:methyl-accepting chemotaxis protein
MLAEIVPALEGYLADARHMNEIAGRSAEDARVELSTFERSFAALERPMESFADAILAHAEQARTGAEERLARSRQGVLLVAALTVALQLGFALAVRASIARPLADILASMRAMASRDFTRRTAVRSRDEIGQIAAAANTAIDAFQDAMSSIERTSNQLTRSSSELRSISSTVCEDSQRTTRAVESATAESRDVSDHVQSAATGVQELEATAQSIADSMNHSAQVARSAAVAAGTATGTVRKLGQSSQEIGGILRLINSVAEQTNLLALNATIEAASAGEAGRGFAIVANEVKALAQQTARATDDIARRVQAIQADSQGAVQAIESIARIIGEMNALTENVSGSISAQSATMTDISSRVSHAAQGTASIVEEFQGVSRRTEDSLGRLQGVAEAADQLNGLARSLEELVERYRFVRVG